MSYKGKYHPTKRERYRGDVNNIIYRSLWERSFMKYCDDNPDVVEWGSEEIVVPYISPIDGKRHRYFPDFYVKTSKGDKFLVEIKPKKQTVEPKVQKRKTKSYIYEVTEYAKNMAKWKAAEEFCKDRMWEFKVLTEDELGIR